MDRFAYSYTRFSTPEQSDGDSERRQIARFMSYCEQHGLVASPDSFNDRGKSGFKGEHLADGGELRRFLDLVREGKIHSGSVLVVENLDRLGRLPVEEAFAVFNGILAAGIKLVTLGDSGVQEYVSGGGLFPLMMALMEMHRSHQESKRKGELIRAVIGHKREEARLLGKPIGDICPTWLRLKPGWRSAALDGSAYEPIPERAEVVVRIFEWAIQGRGKAAIARKLTDLGIASFKSTNADRFHQWSASGVGRILANRATLGEYQPMHTRNTLGKPTRIKAGDPIIDYFPAVVSREMFYEAQAAIDGRRNSKATRQSSNGSLWQGIAKCERCGASMHLLNKGVPPKGGKYLRCANVRSGLCSTRSVRVDESEQVFEGILARLGSIALVKTDTAELERSSRILEGEISELQKKLNELERLLIENSNSSTIANAIRKVETVRAEKQQQLHSIGKQLATEDNLDWDEFLRRIDLVSFEGRMRANAYAKRLGILVLIGPSGYTITRAGETLFVMDYRKGVGAGYWEKGGSAWMVPSFYPVRTLKQHLAEIDASEEAAAREAKAEGPLTDEDIEYLDRDPER